MMQVLALTGIGSDLLLRTLSASCSKAIDIIAYIATHPSTPGFQQWDNAIIDTDINHRIKNINLLTQHLNQKHLSNLISSCLHDIQTCIDDIIVVLDKVSTLKQYQQTLYFNSWSFRQPSCQPYIDSLHRLSNVLRNRVSELHTFASITHNTETIQ